MAPSLARPATATAVRAGTLPQTIMPARAPNWFVAAPHRQLDVFVGKRPSGEQRGQLVRRDRLVWVGTPTTKLDLSRPLPLVV